MASKIIPFPNHARPRLVSPTAETPIVSSTVAEPAPRRTVTFRRPFQLQGMDAPHAAGTFELRQTREALDVMWEAYRVSLRIVLVDGSSSEALDVTASDLDAALALDLAAP